MSINKNILTKFLSLFALLFVVTFNSCVDDEYDAPPTEILPDIEANATIADLKALAANNSITEISEDLIIDAIVIADDASGNFFRQIIVQDETGGLAINFDLVEAHNFFPVGREIFIKAQGLFVERDGQILELGGFKEIENGAEGLGDILDIDDHLVKGRRNQFVTPKVITIDQFNMNDVNTLVQINEVEFVNLGETYADAVGRNSQNKDITDCDGDETIIRSSGFANFAAVTVAEGNGNLTAVLSAFGSTFQLLIRDLDDVPFNNPRCTGGGGGGTGNEELMTIADVRSLISIGSAPAERKVRGIVISDLASGNITNRNLYLQDESGGIVVRFASAHDFQLNDEVEIVVSGVEISEFNGLMQLNNVPNNNATKITNGTSPTPRPATISEILANAEEWESTLVIIENVTISGDGIYDFLTELDDGTGSIDMFTSSFADFAEAPLPGEPVTLVGIVSQFNSSQIVIRNLDDVDGDGGGGGDPVFMSIEDVRGLWNMGSTSVPNERKIKGIVISDTANGNMTGRNLAIQEGEFGIIVRFNDNHSFQLGEEIEVIISNDELSEFNGLLQVNNVDNANATSLGIGTMPTPRETTISEVLANWDTWESTLVRIEDVLIEGVTTYNGGSTVTDGSASIDMFTRSDATFSDSAVPTGEVTITAIVSEFNTPQILIRNLDDVEE